MDNYSALKYGSMILSLFFTINLPGINRLIHFYPHDLLEERCTKLSKVADYKKLFDYCWQDITEYDPDIYEVHIFKLKYFKNVTRIK